MAIPDREHLLHQLWAIQQQQRQISDETIIALAQQNSLPRAQIEQVVEFYSFFHREPRGQIELLFSNCSSCGSISLMQHLCELLDCEPGTVSCSGHVSIDTTSCIGMCDHGPSALVNGVPITSLTQPRIEQMAELIRARSVVDSWPEAWFTINNRVLRRDLLLHDPVTAEAAIDAVISEGKSATLEKIRKADLRGRGGAGFSTAQKWQFCLESESDRRYVICNADEGEPGTFKDRLLLSEHADLVISGMAICGRIIGATQGYIYLRSEYRYLLPQLEQTLTDMRNAGLLGSAIRGIDTFNFDVAIIVGAGAYICGEESALIESIEEKPGIPRIRPPFPVTSGLYGKPTVVNNVETLLAAAAITAHPGQWFERVGTWQSHGTKLLSISGDCSRPGIYEYPFGITVNDILRDAGAGHVQAVQVGGPSGRLIAPENFDHHIAFEDLATGGSLMIYHRSRDLLATVAGFARFFAHESCGFCTPCRVGTTLLSNGMTKVCDGHATAHDVDELKRTAALVSRRSHCGLGMTAPNPIRDAIKDFPELFEQRLLHHEMEPEFDLDAALSEARNLTNRDDAEAHL